MRIVIEVDGVPAGQPTSTGVRGEFTTEAARQPAQLSEDAGSGPALAAEHDASGASDGGPPPDWLLQAVAAAEAAGMKTASTPENGYAALSEDAGAAPPA